MRALLFVCLSTLSACSQLIKAWCQLSCFLPCCLSGVTSSRHHLPLLLVLLLRSCSSSHLNWVVPSLNSLRTLLLDFASPYFFFSSAVPYHPVTLETLLPSSPVCDYMRLTPKHHSFKTVTCFERSGTLCFGKSNIGLCRSV